MTRKWISITLSSLLLFCGVFTVQAHAQLNMAACKGLVFSTEEDFLTRGPEPTDGNPIISDGDLLSWNFPGPGAVVCARNRDLLSFFNIRVDLGLDAVDAIESDVDSDKPLIAFSTELDDPEGRFTAGDLLTTDGAVLPNSALMALFQLPVPEDIGLDALQIIGDTQMIIRLLEALKGMKRPDWLENPGQLSVLLKRLNVDIWFSTEGTGPFPQSPSFLDGDLLSARDGIIVAPNELLLPPSVPAGIPNRGVDFGLDAVNADRKGNRSSIHYSTEILYEGKPIFTDGDILALGDGVVIANSDLVTPLEPKANFIGLDAIAFPSELTDCQNQITDIGGLQVDVADINVSGRAVIGYPTDHPFGRNVPFWGTICDDITKFRVVFRDFTAGLGTGTGIPVPPAEGWMVKDRHPVTGACTIDAPWFSNANGWFDGPRYRDLLFCNSNLILTNWKSNSAPDPNALYWVWLEYDRGFGTETEPVPHLVRLDNIPPVINNLDIPGGACTTYSSTDMPIMVKGDFFDEHFWNYRLSIAGDLYPDHSYSLIHYYDAVPQAANLSPTGTTPLGTLVDLHEVSVFDLAASPVRCAYSVRIWVRDRSIMGYFNPAFNLVGGFFRSPASRAIFFDYAP